MSKNLRDIQENKTDLTNARAPANPHRSADADLPTSSRGQVFNQTMTIDGVQRNYDIYVPNSVARQIRKEGLDNIDTMLAFHGTGGTSRSTIDGNLNLADVANRQNRILIAPQALGQNDPSSPHNPEANPSHWHVEGKEQKGPPVSDKAFLKALQSDAERQLFDQYGQKHTQENFGKLDKVHVSGMSNGSVMAADVASNPKTYLRDGTAIKSGAFVTASQNVELHDGNAPTTISGEQLFIFGGKDQKMLGSLFQQDPSMEKRWLESAGLTDRQKQQYDEIKNPERQATFALEHQGTADPATGRTVVGQMIYEGGRERVVSAAAAQGVTISDQDFDQAMHQTKWGETGRMRFKSDDGQHQFNARVDIARDMGHEWSNDPKEVERTGYNVNDRIARSDRDEPDRRDRSNENDAPALASNATADLQQDRPRHHGLRGFGGPS